MRHPDERSADARPGAGGPGGSAHADEGTIHAWLDHALPPDEAVALERHVAECAACRAQLAEARGLIAATSRILAALDDVPGGVLPAAGRRPAAGDRPAASDVATPAALTAAVHPLRPTMARQSARGRWRGWRVQAAAAVALLAVGTTAVLQRSSSEAFLADSVVARETAAVSAFGGPGATAGGAASQPQVPPLARPPVAPEGVAGELEERVGGGGTAGAAADAAAGASQKALARAESPPSAGTPPAGLIIAPIVPPVLPPVPPGREAVALRAPAPMPLALAQAAAADDRGVAGRVVTAGSGAPVAGATVSVPSVGRSAVTDSTGRFSLGALPPGSYTGAVRRIGFAPGRVELTVRDPESPPTVEVALQPVRLQLESVTVSGIAAEPGTADRAVAAPSPPVSAATALAGRAASAPPPGAVAGCYALELGSGEVSVLRAVERTLPGILWLLPAAAEDHPGWLAATSGASRGAQPVPGARWRAPAGDSVELVWSAGAAPLRLTLSVTGDGLAGSAVFLEDDAARGADRDAVRLTARRRACPES